MASLTEKEFAEFDANNMWNEVYQRLKNEATLATSSDIFSTKCARQPENRRRNRYRDVSPYDHSRVKLSGENDYINASLVEVPDANRKYILTQGPLEHTKGDFWQMAWEQKSKAIVMLNRVIEKGSVKCSQYWPLGADHGREQDMYFEECNLKVTLVAEQDFQHFTLRTLELESLDTGDRREILHFHYTTWPDFGVPSSPHAFLHFLHSVRETGLLEADVGPAIVHCSAGIGRSGTFCLVDSCLVIVESSGTLKHINVRQTLIEMRSYRMGLIQTTDQLRFSYLAIIEGAHAILEGDGLGSLQMPIMSRNENHVDGPSSIAPARTAKAHSLKKQEFLNVQDFLHITNDEAPPIPPKKSPVPRGADYNMWEKRPEKEQPAKEEIINDDSDDDSEEFDKLIDRTEGDSMDESGDSDDQEFRAAEEKHQIREERKKQTMDKIQQMKERQKKSGRWRPPKPHFQHYVYISVAVVVGVTAVVVYKYFL